MEALRSVFPSQDWLEWKFSSVPKNFWEHQKNQRHFLEYTFTTLKLRKPEDWYTVKISQVHDLGGEPLFDYYYGSSLILCLQTIFPEFDWKVWRFSHVAKGFWTDEANVKKYLEWLADQLDIVDASDWKNVTTAQIHSFRGKSLLLKYGGLSKVLERFFPHLLNQVSGNSDDKSGWSYVSKAQTFLQKSIEELFPQVEVKMNYHHPDVRYSDTNRSVELDIFIPSLSLAFEYHVSPFFLKKKKKLFIIFNISKGTAPFQLPLLCRSS